jgi:transcription antitermination factor NusG
MDVLAYPGFLNSQATTQVASSATQYPWYALKVRIRSELLASTALRARGYDPLLPTYNEKRIYSDRYKTLEAPVFPGYIFCRFNSDHKSPILSCPAVHGLVSFGGQPAVISDEDMEAVRKTIAAGGQPSQYIPVGQRVRITSGVLAGLEGVLLSAGKRNRLVVSIHLLQRSVAVEIGRECLKPL